MEGNISRKSTVSFSKEEEEKHVHEEKDFLFILFFLLYYMWYFLLEIRRTAIFCIYIFFISNFIKFMLFYVCCMLFLYAVCYFCLLYII